MVRLSHVLIASLAILLVIAPGKSSGHVPDHLLIDLELGEETWSATSEMDIKFAVVALMQHYLPPDSGSGWIDNLQAGQLGLVRDLTEKLYRERFQLADGGEPLEIAFRFPDFEEEELRFGIGENEEPVIRVEMRGTLTPQAREPLTVTWAGRWGPTLVLMVRNEGEPTGPVYRAGLGESVEIRAVDRIAAAEKRSGDSLGLFGWSRHGFLQAFVPGVHALFLVGLFFVAAQRQFVLLQVLCFALAHTATYWLVSLGVFTLPLAVIAPFLAVGVVYLGLENLVLKSPGSWRLGLVTGLGLVHGIGLGLAVRKLPVPQEGSLLPLAGYQLGFALAVLCVLLVGAGLLVPLLRREKFVALRVSGSLAISLAGGYQAMLLIS